MLGIGALPRAPGDHPKPASPPPWSPLPRARGSPADDRRTGIDTQPFPARAGVTRRQATPPLGIGALPRTPRDHPPPGRDRHHRPARPLPRAQYNRPGCSRTPFRTRGSPENPGVSTADHTLPSPKTPSRTHGITRHRASRTSARERTTTTGGESGKGIMRVAERAGRRGSPAARSAFGCPPHAATGQAGRNPTPAASGPIRTTPPACSRPTGKDTAMR